MCDGLARLNLASNFIACGLWFHGSYGLNQKLNNQALDSAVFIGYTGFVIQSTWRDAALRTFHCRRYRSPSERSRQCHAHSFAPSCSRLPVRAFLFALTSALACFLACASSCLADVIPWDANAQGRFITSFCPGTNNAVWIGTEEQGVWRYDPAAPAGKQFTHYTTQDGLGDNNAYALAVDHAGRLWAGTLSHGVSVFNGKTWRTYGPQDGPLGSRVFALAVNPKDGGVWGATEAGLFRYQNSHWTYFTRADGLPSDQANALAFDQGGTLYVGTQCDGIAIASPADGYKSWRIVPGPQTLPNAPSGTGLPSALINCLLVTKSGTVYAGTDGGLAASTDEGRTWTYRRGLDWKAKEAGLFPPVPPASVTVSGNLLSEDYVTCLAEGADGSLFVGHRQTSVEAFSPKTWLRVQSGLNGAKPDSYVNALLVSGQSVWAGLYGGGVLPPGAATKLSSNPVALPVPPLPVPAKPPTLVELNAVLRVVSAVAPDKSELAPKVVALEDDWVTQGDWLGRYGRYWVCLNAICSPNDYTWGAGWQNVVDFPQMGSNHSHGDTLRRWVQWLYTQDPHVLEMPPTYLDSRVKKGLTTPDKNRREAEQDDHGEAYSWSMDGPHVFTTLSVPSGLFILSLYEVNYNGHGSSERDRDYRVSVRPQPNKRFDDISNFGALPELAHGRIRSFWGGVYKRFLVQGPLTLTVQVDRNNSCNTMLPGVMLDLADELPPPYFRSVSDWQEAQLSPAVWPAPAAADPAASLLDALGGVRRVNTSWWASHSRRDYLELLRWYKSYPTTSRDAAYWRRLASCYYGSGLYGQWEDSLRMAGLTPARDIEKALKWDGSYDLRGQGNRITRQYLLQHPEINKQTRQTSVAMSDKKHGN